MKWGSTFLYLLAEGGSRQRLSLSVRYIFVFDADQWGGIAEAHSHTPTFVFPNYFRKNGCNLLVCSDYNPPASSVCCPASPICWKCASPSVDCFPSWWPFFLSWLAGRRRNTKSVLISQVEDRGKRWSDGYNQHSRVPQNLNWYLFHISNKFMHLYRFDGRGQSSVRPRR